jgi:hypothetical protein
MTTYHSQKVLYFLPSFFSLPKHQRSASLLGLEARLSLLYFILLWSMSRSHKFVIENYKDSWNDGPPWPVCTYCDPYIQSDASIASRLKQTDLTGTPFFQSPDLLSPEALEFYPGAYQPSNNPSGHRLYRSLPSRRHQGPFAPSHPPIQPSSYYGVRPFRSTTHCFTPTGMPEPTNFHPDFRHASMTGYDGSGSPGGQIRANLWHTLPTKSRTRQTNIQDIYYPANLLDTLNPDTDSQSLNRASEHQLSFLGSSIPRAAGTEFISHSQQNVQFTNPKSAKCAVYESGTVAGTINILPPAHAVV